MYPSLEKLFGQQFNMLSAFHGGEPAKGNFGCTFSHFLSLPSTERMQRILKKTRLLPQISPPKVVSCRYNITKKAKRKT